MYENKIVNIRKNEYTFLKDMSIMVHIPAGNFFMGAVHEDLFAEESMRPYRQVYLDEYYIDKYPVTNRQYKLFIDSNGYNNLDYWTDKGYRFIKRNKITCPASWNNKLYTLPDLPVSGVSWYEAEAYCRWAGKNLPTEAEWEKAARGSDGRLYPWGNSFPESKKLVNYNNTDGGTTPVKKYKKGISPFGCHDMSGNVNNWVYDWHFKSFGRYCIANRLDNNPCLDDKLYNELKLGTGMKIDKGGGYATSNHCWFVLKTYWKLKWRPETREPWNGFRTVYRIGY